MLRTLAHHLLNASGLESRSLLAASARLFQLTPERYASNKEQDDLPKKRELKNKELKEAAINAAKSVKGDWTRTADDLLSRLQVLESHEETGSQTAQAENVSAADTIPSKLLSTMKVMRGETKPSSQFRSALNNIDKPTVMKQAEFQDNFLRKRRSRRNEVFTELYNVPRLGIFDPEKVKTLGDQPSFKPGLWELVNEETIRDWASPLPRNAFEEMIQWTKEGKLWTFPIDNEADMLEERKYSFQDHVFFDQFLTEFPAKGPVRKFMELVTLGLSMNPYITVPEKHEHIRWFADYFRQKEAVLVDVIGDNAKMKEAIEATAMRKEKKSQSEKTQ